MQQRRFRPGDVLDDYCPRERRITDHAVVAMIDEKIKQTRCCVCDAEHGYKDGKVPAQRRRKPQPALFTQVLEGLQGPQAARLAHPEEADLDAISDIPDGDASPTAAAAHRHVVPDVQGPSDEQLSGNGHSTLIPHPSAVAEEPPSPDTAALSPSGDEGPVRRSLIRATLPRPEGQAAPTRVMPEFTIRQPNNNGRGGRRRGAQQHGHGSQGPMRFGRGGHGNGHGPSQGQPHGQRQHGGRNRSRRGGKKG